MAAPTTLTGFGFPEGFRWGVATSSYQIEGAVDEDGKGPSIWDTYAHTPGKIRNGDTGDVANDHYHRYTEDVALMKAMGANAYRFSISWPRIFPDGTGQPNPKGLDFYSRLVDELLAAGIEPFATLYHWDLPQALQDRGGWQSRDTAKAFADYAGYMAEKLSDRVTHFFTLNEFCIFMDMGHRGLEMEVGGGTCRVELAPGLKLPPAELNQVRHHAVLAHGLGVQAIRAQRQRPAPRCGPAENISVAVPLIDTPEHIRAAETATRELNAPYLTVMLEGKLHRRLPRGGRQGRAEVHRRGAEDDRPPVDFVGINVYRPGRPTSLASDEAPGYREVPINASHPKMHIAWQRARPGVAVLGAAQFAQSLWNATEIYITENGCARRRRGWPTTARSTTPTASCSCAATWRSSSGRPPRACRCRATSTGALMDNFEWSAGYGNRFGLVYVDFETQKRTPKLSAHYFREVIAQNAVLP